jgi:hypothetical protein
MSEIQLSDIRRTEVPKRAKVQEYLIRTNGNGEIVSQLGPCVCGKPKREWHKICLKEPDNGR